MESAFDLQTIDQNRRIAYNTLFKPFANLDDKPISPPAKGKSVSRDITPTHSFSLPGSQEQL